MSDLFLLMIVFIVVGISTSMYLEGYTNDMTLVESNVDGRSYLVRNLPDKDKAAATLSIIRAKLLKFVNHLAQKYPKDPRCQRLKRQFDPDAISESTPDSKYTSYSVNKGAKVVFCIRQRDDNNTLVDMNMLAFVAIHEMSHLMTTSIGHTEEFWNNMKFLLAEAMDKDVQLYRYEAYHERPQEYCGTKVTDTPLKLS